MWGGGYIKTLFISDLDGTLLRSDSTVSEYTCQVITELMEKGMLFSYATGRPYITAAKATEKLAIKVPVITYNGALILESGTKKVLMRTPFGEEQKQEIFRALGENDICPIVYAYLSDEERVSCRLEECNVATKAFLKERLKEVGSYVKSVQDLTEGDVLCFTCVDSFENLEPIYNRFKEKYQCFFFKDIYSGEQGMDIVPQHISKAGAIAWLKEYLGADYVVAFGDGGNDIEMFELADEAYAVANAAEELKAIATGVIGGNDEDGVAEYLEKMQEV